MGRINRLQLGQRHNRQLQRLLADSGENWDGALVVQQPHGRWVTLKNPRSSEAWMKQVHTANTSQQLGRNDTQFVKQLM